MSNLKKKTLLFIDHPHHLKTKSTFFLRKIFEEKFKIKNIWSQNVNYKNLKNYNYIFLFQSFLKFEDLVKLRDKKIIWAPMYDSLKNFDSNIFKICSLFKNIKILSFSKEIRNICIKNKIKYLDVQYMKKPLKINFKPKKKLNIFFWYRGDVKLKELINIVKYINYEKIYYYYLPDPTYRKPKEIDLNFRKKFKIDLIYGSYLKSNKTYIKFLKKSSINISSRRKEGIGMSNIEAMIYNNFLIGYNQNTIDQYIKNRKLGFLLNKNTNVNIINKNFINKFSKYRYEYYLKTFLNWKKQEKKILNIYNYSFKDDNKVSILFYWLYLNNVLYNFLFKLRKNIYNLRNNKNIN